MEALGLSRGFRKLVGPVEGCLLLLGGCQGSQGEFWSVKVWKGSVRSLHDWQGHSRLVWIYHLFKISANISLLKRKKRLINPFQVKRKVIILFRTSCIYSDLTV